LEVCGLAPRKIFLNPTIYNTGSAPSEDRGDEKNSVRRAVLALPIPHG